MVKKRKYDEDAKRLVATKLKESRGTTKMPGIISINAEAGILVSIMPDLRHCANTYVYLGGEMDGAGRESR